MSLQVWLPLNGDLHNQGLMPITFSTTTVNWNAAGKIGQAFSTLNSNVIGTCPNLNGVTTFSLTFWCFPKTNSSITTNWCNIIALGSKSADNSTSAEFRFESSYGNTYILSHHNNSGDPIGGGTASLVSERDKWYHVAVVVNNESHTIRYYVNGVQLTTSGFLKTHNGGHLDGTIKLANENVDPDCLLNDVRIYDHALSEKEIEEIAKGLVLHYKLDNNYTANENLMPNHLEMGLGSANPSTGTWRLAGSSSMTKSRVQILDSPEGPCYGFQNEGIQTPNDGSCYGIDSFPLEGNSIYTISMWARIISGTEGYAGYNIYNSTDKGGSHSSTQKNYRVTQLPSNGDWIKCWYTFTTNSNNTRNIYIGIVTGETSVTTQMCCVHIEKVDATTYTTIYDCSGYNNNGTLSNGMTNILYNTPRYNTSLCLSKKKISANTGFPTGTNPDFTIVFWTRLYSDITYVSYGDLVGMNDIAEGANSPFRLELCGTPPSNNLMWFRGPSGQASGGFNMNSNSSSGWFSKGVWHQIALTGNGATKQYLCYLDGAQCGAYNGSNNTWTPNGKIYFGDTVEATADFSDCRVYATVLTAEQIKELYNTSMSIDDKGNIHARELVEL